MSDLFHIVLLATGGTIEKTYDAHAGTLVLAEPVIESMLADMTHPDIRFDIERPMMLDSLDMGPAERETITRRIATLNTDTKPDAIVITHGTDTLAETARAIEAGVPTLSCPVILTGAMRPFRVANSDAAQNLAQTILAARLLGPGVYCVAHGRIIPAARLRKDYERLTFVDDTTG